jgi:hypothetical protein
MSLQFILGQVALLASALTLGLILLRRAVTLKPAAEPAAQPEPVQQLLPALTVTHDDPVVADLAGLLRRHLDMLPQNYDAVPAWERLVEDTVRVLTRNKLAPVAKLVAERQCATTH